MSTPSTPFTHSTTATSIFLPASTPNSTSGPNSSPNSHASAKPTTRKHALIYVIPGNPGLIAYYADFLAFLSSMLQASDITETAYDIYGRDLRGFRDEDHEPFGGAGDGDGDGNLPWDLEGQIGRVYEDIAAQRRRDVEHDASGKVDGEMNGGTDGGTDVDVKGRPYDFVVLVGHSVGAYIAVEIFSRHTSSTSTTSSTKQTTPPNPHLSLRNGILLFPTLTNIALSPSGRRMTTLNSTPYIGPNAHTLANLALSLLSEPTLKWIIQNIIGFSPHAATVTASWLKSRDGVWQAIHLGLSEMRTIKEDVWEEELWHVADAADGEGRPRFYLFYGREDHWVASRLRDEFIEKKKGRARVAIDEGDVPHAFCTRERPSWLIAKKVSEWVEEMEGIRQHKA